MTSLDNWRVSLSHLKQDVTSFSSDNINLIDTYYPRTRIQTPIIAILKELNSYLSANLHPEVKAAFETMKGSLVGQLEGRIALIDGANRESPKDRWAAQSLKVQSSARESLLSASAHFQDVQLLCSELVKHNILFKKLPQCVDCVKLLKKSLNDYAQLLDANEKAEILSKLSPELDLLTKEMESEKPERIKMVQILERINSIITRGL